MLKYKIIKSQEQYNKYCNTLERIVFDNPEKEDEIELLTLLIETWELARFEFEDKDPVEILISLMQEHNLKAMDLMPVLSLSKGTISKILNYKKGFSKQTILKLAEYFKVSQELFNRTYILKGTFSTEKSLNMVGESKDDYHVKK